MKENKLYDPISGDVMFDDEASWEWSTPEKEASIPIFIEDEEENCEPGSIC